MRLEKLAKKDRGGQRIKGMSCHENKYLISKEMAVFDLQFIALPPTEGGGCMALDWWRMGAGTWLPLKIRS